MEREDGRGRHLAEVGRRKEGKIVYVVFMHYISVETGTVALSQAEVSQISVNKSGEEVHAYATMLML